jgi:hypothetical protein
MPKLLLPIAAILLAAYSSLAADAPAWPQANGPFGNFNPRQYGVKLVDDLAQARQFWVSEFGDLGFAKGSSSGYVQHLADVTTHPGSSSGLIVAEGKVFASSFRPRGDVWPEQMPHFKSDKVRALFDDPQKAAAIRRNSALDADDLTVAIDFRIECRRSICGGRAERRPKPADDGERLESGSAKPAPALATSDDSWPANLRDNLRSSWSSAKIPDKLQAVWTIRPAQPLDGLIGREWTNQWYGQGPVTGVSVAEGVAVLALTDRQQVVALDPATGRERWRAIVEGRVDSQPTIAKGTVFAGTRSGWLYAFNRDTGERLWRFRAAPRREQIVVDGQLESPWPVFGTVTVDDEGVWAVAGRHNDCDGGLWWWRFDAATGKPLASGRLGREELRDNTGDTSPVAPDSEWPAGANSPPVTDGRLFLMPRVRLVRDNGRLVPTSITKDVKKMDEGIFWANAYALGILSPGNQGLLNRVEFLGGYKMSAYGHVQARMFAYQGNRFVCVGGTDGAVQHRGGGQGSGVRAFERKSAIEPTTVVNAKEPDRPIKKAFGSEMKWDNPMTLARGDGTQSLAVAGDHVLVGLSVTNNDQHKERQRLPFRLAVLGLADGQQQQELPLPAKPILGGISAAASRVYVTTEDGTVTCFAAGREPSR